jgi:predicted enzyme related to lactoylglutathione lyase
MTKVANVYVVAEDTGGLADFYRVVLAADDQFADGTRWVQLRVGDLAFAVANQDEGSVKPGNGAVITFEVDNLESAVELVLSKGGTSAPPRDMGSHGRAALCKDPEGNAFQLFSRSH